MTVLVVADFNNDKLSSASLATISCAKLLASDITLLLIGDKCDLALEHAKSCANVSKILMAKDTQLKHNIAENLANIVVDCAVDYKYILAPATTFGKNFLPKVAAKLDLYQISDVVEVIDKNTFKHPIYAGNALETVRSNQSKHILTVRPTAFVEVEADIQKDVEVELVEIPSINTDINFIKLENSAATDMPDLATAKIVVSGGRGLQNKENFNLIYELAAKLNAAVGATRAAVDAGFIANDHQVGQTGKIVAPDLYIAVGISGAIQHIAGIKDSKLIVAINKDPDAAIFEVADYGLVADLFEVIPELINCMSNNKS